MVKPDPIHQHTTDPAATHVWMLCMRQQTNRRHNLHLLPKEVLAQPGSIAQRMALCGHLVYPQWVNNEPVHEDDPEQSVFRCRQCQLVADVIITGRRRSMKYRHPRVEPAGAPGVEPAVGSVKKSR